MKMAGAGLAAAVAAYACYGGTKPAAEGPPPAGSVELYVNGERVVVPCVSLPSFSFLRALFLRTHIPHKRSHSLSFRAGRTTSTRA